VEENLSLKLKDVNGRIIYQQRCVEVTGAINVPDFLSGLYFVELVGQRSHYLGKIVFQK
jgi:pterin-4a-carbinolamine dehydratase